MPSDPHTVCSSGSNATDTSVSAMNCSSIDLRVGGRMGGRMGQRMGVGARVPPRS